MAGLHSRQVASPSQDTDDPSHTLQQPFRVPNQANVHQLSEKLNTERAGEEPTSRDWIYADIF